MPVCRLGSGGKSSKFQMALRKKQLLLLHVVIAKSTTSLRSRRIKYLKQFWVRPIFRTRAQLSEMFTLVKTVKELQEEDHEGYLNYFRMLPNQFAGLFTQFGKATNLEVQ